MLLPSPTNVLEMSRVAASGDGPPGETSFKGEDTPAAGPESIRGRWQRGPRGQVGRRSPERNGSGPIELSGAPDLGPGGKLLFEKPGFPAVCILGFGTHAVSNRLPETPDA